MTAHTRALLEEAKMMLYGVVLMSQNNLIVNHVNVMKLVSMLDTALKQDGDVI